MPHITIIILTVVMWSSYGIYLNFNFADMELAVVCEGVSLILGSLLTLTTFYLFFVRRQAVTEVINKLDQEVRKIYVRTERQEVWRKRFNDLYYKEGLILFIVCTAGITPLFISQCVVPLIKGELAYTTVLPLNKTPYSGQWWIEYFYQAFVLTLTHLYYDLKEYLMLDVFIQMSVLYEMVTDDFKYLCKETNFKMEEEYEKLRNIMRTLRNINE